MDIQWTYKKSTLRHQLHALNQTFAMSEASHQALLAGSPLELQEPAIANLGLGADI